MANYITTASGGVRLASKENPSPYTDPANPQMTPSDVLNARHKAEHAELGVYCAIGRRESINRGEGHERENKPWRLGRHEVTMDAIDSDSALLTWLLQEGLTERISPDTTETGLHSLCYRLCMEDVRFLRVHQRDRHHSVAMEAAANAANLLWACVLSPESTVRVRGKYAGLTLLQASLDSSGGKFPIMRLVGWLCSLETMSELNRTRLEYSEKQAAALTRYIETMQIDGESDTDVNGWIRLLHETAATEEARGKDTIRQDMLALYKFLRLDRQSANLKSNRNGGNISREGIMAHFSWSKSYCGRVMMELRISRDHWFLSEENGRAQEMKHREDYRKGFIGNKGAKIAA